MTDQNKSSNAELLVTWWRDLLAGKYPFIWELIDGATEDPVHLRDAQRNFAAYEMLPNIEHIRRIEVVRATYRYGLSNLRRVYWNRLLLDKQTHPCADSMMAMRTGFAGVLSGFQFSHGWKSNKNNSHLDELGTENEDCLGLLTEAIRYMPNLSSLEEYAAALSKTPEGGQRKHIERAMAEMNSTEREELFETVWELFQLILGVTNQLAESSLSQVQGPSSNE